MAVRLYANNAASTLSVALTNGATGCDLSSGQGSLFPSPSGSDWFIATIESGATREIVKVTARNTDHCTITREQESTSSPSSFPAGSKFELRVTAASFDSVGGLPTSGYAVGDLLYASGAANLSTLPIGAAGSVLTSSSALPQWTPFLTTKGDLLYASSSAPTYARLAIGSTDQVLKVSSGLPAWGTVPITTNADVDLPLAEAILPDASGSGNNPPELAREISSGTQTTNSPKNTTLVAKFDAATDEHLIWNRRLPRDYSATPQLVVTWSMNSATGSRTVWKGSAAVTTVGVDARALVFNNVATIAATNGTTAGSTRTAIISLATTNFATGLPVAFFVGRDADATGDTASGDAVLRRVTFRYTKA